MGCFTDCGARRVRRSRPLANGTRSPASETNRAQPVDADCALGSVNLLEWESGVWTLKRALIAREDGSFFGHLQSRAHELWTRAGCSWMGIGNDPRYNSSRTFDAFAFPWPPGREPADDPRVVVIGEAAKALVAWRDAWLNPPGLSEAQLKNAR